MDRLDMQCFQKANTEPPVCGVHGVRLVWERLEYRPGRTAECLRCPKTGTVIDEHKKKVDNRPI